MHISVSAAENTRFCVRGEALLCGSDICASITGGTLAHIGAVSLAVYEPERGSATVSTVSVFTHRDGELSARIAKELSRTFRCTATVSVGIHVDSAGAAEIAELQNNALECCRKLIRALTSARSEQAQLRG